MESSPLSSNHRQ